MNKVQATLTGPSRTRVFEYETNAALGWPTRPVFAHFQTDGECPAVPGEKLTVKFEGKAGTLREFYSVKRHPSLPRVVFRFEDSTYQTYEVTV